MSIFMRSNESQKHHKSRIHVVGERVETACNKVDPLSRGTDGP
jgi:hypothetical protein